MQALAPVTLRAPRPAAQRRPRTLLGESTRAFIILISVWLALTLVYLYCENKNTEHTIPFPPARTVASSNPTTSAVAVNSAVDIDWDKLGFGLTPTASMYVATCVRGEEARQAPRRPPSQPNATSPRPANPLADCARPAQWTAGALRPYGNLEMSPASGVLNYGQGVFEGLKAYRTVAGRVVLFRPNENAARCAAGAVRMSMPPVPTDIFLDAVKKVAAANMDYIPPEGKGSLYLRPLLVGSGPILGLAPAPEYTFLVYASPVASYFKGGQMVPIDLLVETEYHRAAPGGVGGTKCVGNYSPVLKTQLAAKGQGFSDVLYLDARENKYLEEVSSCNIFVVKGKTITTPPTSGTILPGITRKSIMEIARDRGFTVEERPIAAEELYDVDEVFCTGTAVVVIPVGSTTYKGKKTAYSGKVAEELYTALTTLQSERSPDKFNWLTTVEAGSHR